MQLSAPLKVTVTVELEGGPAAGERRFRLCRRIALPPALELGRELPVEGEAPGRVCFSLPGQGTLIEAAARLRHDPEHPERGSEVELLGLAPEAVQQIERYIEERLRT